MPLGLAGNKTELENLTWEAIKIGNKYLINDDSQLE